GEASKEVSAGITSGVRSSGRPLHDCRGRRVDPSVTTPAVSALACRNIAAIIADPFWFQLGRSGWRILKLLCRVSLEPDCCVRQTESAFLKYRLRQHDRPNRGRSNELLMRNNLRRSDPSRCASEQPFAVHRQVVPSFQMVVSSQFPIGTRRRIPLRREEVHATAFAWRTSNSHEGERRKSGAHASSLSAAVAPTATPDAQHPDRSSNRRPVNSN